MRYFEIASGYTLPVSVEEQEVLDRIGNKQLLASEFNEREAEVARLMVNRGLLHRLASDGAISFSANLPTDTWRF